MNKVIVLAGISGSGKSTYAETLKLRDPFGTIVVSSDEIRGILNGDVNDQSDPEAVFRTVDRIVDGSLNTGLTPIVDATNLAPWQRKSYVRAAYDHGVPVELHYVLATFGQAVRRQEGRERKVPVHVIERQAKQYDEDTKRPVVSFYAEGFHAVRFVT